MLNIRSFSLENKEYFNALQEYNISQEEVQANKDIYKESSSNQRICLLCQIKHPPQDVAKTLNVRMIIAVQGSLRKRGICIYSHFCIKTEQFQSLSIRVCNLCYMVIVQEYTLIEISRVLARLTGNRSIEDKLVEDDFKFQMKLNGAIESNGVDSFTMLQSRKIQWRIMICLQSIEEIPDKLLVKSKQYFIWFKMLRNIFSCQLEFDKAEMEKMNADEIFTEMFLKRCFNMMNTMRQYKSKSLPINGLLINYFFSIDERIKSFLGEIDMEFQITQGNEYGQNIIAKGNFHPLREFASTGNAFFGKVQRYSAKIKLFTQEMKEIQLNTIFGLSRDDENTVPLELNRYGNHHIFLPHLPFYTSDPLPTPWLEIFEQNPVHHFEQKSYYDIEELQVEESIDEELETEVYHPVVHIMGTEKYEYPKKIRPSTAFANNPRLYSSTHDWAMHQAKAEADKARRAMNTPSTASTTAKPNRTKEIAKRLIMSLGTAMSTGELPKRPMSSSNPRAAHNPDQMSRMHTPSARPQTSSQGNTHQLGEKHLKSLKSSEPVNLQVPKENEELAGGTNESEPPTSIPSLKEKSKSSLFNRKEGDLEGPPVSDRGKSKGVHSYPKCKKIGSGKAWTDATNSSGSQQQFTPIFGLGSASRSGAFKRVETTRSPVDDKQEDIPIKDFIGEIIRGEHGNGNRPGTATLLTRSNKIVCI